jgi:2-dehydro-3-deoxygluconokinase
MSATFTSIGECMVELSPAGDGLYRRGFAGDTLNTAWGVRALTAPDRLRVRYQTAVGTDRISDEMVAFLAAAGLDTGAIHRVPDRTVGLYMITLDGAERSFTYWRGQSAARLLASEAADFARHLADTDTAYVSGITLAILPAEDRDMLLGALEGVAARGGVVAFDPNYRARLWGSRDEARAAFRAACRVASIVLPTFSDEADLFGDPSSEATAERIAAYGAGEVVVKNGAEPCLVVADGRPERVPAVRVDEPVDTTGAGDGFNAGYLAARIAGRTPAEAAAHGHLVAARVVQVHGALAPPDRLADLRV